MLKGVLNGMLLLGPPDQGPFTPAAIWPNPTSNVKHLAPAAERALKERRGLLIKNESVRVSDQIIPESHHIAYPVEVSGKVHGVVVLEAEQSPRGEIQDIMRRLHWGAAWLEVMVRRSEAAKSDELNEWLEKVLDLVATVVEQEGFHGSAMALVTRLATVVECDRVSLGWTNGKHVRVDVMSHTSEFGKQTNLVRAIGAAMDESIDQNAVVTYPLPADAPPLVTRVHEELSKQQGPAAILTLPFVCKGKLVGGLTLERPENKPFDKNTVEACESLVALVAPILYTKRLEERWLIRKMAESLATQLKRILGPGYLVRKLILIMILGLVVFFYFFKIDFRVTAPTNIEGEVQRVVAAPFNGYIKEASVRPGDVVQEGKVLCLLDDRDLKLEHLKWSTEKEQLTKQYHEAMAKRERSQITITRAKIDQAEAQLGLIQEQLARTKVTAPFNGVIMSGDLSQSLGAPVERGQVLFQVAPLDAYRVIAEVDERDILYIKIGQKSDLVLPSMSEEVFPFVVEKITPVSIAREGRNYFRVEAKMETISDRLRPGMEGVGKITIDRRRLIWVWTHEAIDWVRLKLWAWWP
jgi:RND family efflux transporter MFP subunit